MVAIVQAVGPGYQDLLAQAPGYPDSEDGETLKVSSANLAAYKLKVHWYTELNENNRNVRSPSDSPDHEPGRGVFGSGRRGQFWHRRAAHTGISGRRCQSANGADRRKRALGGRDWVASFCSARIGLL